MKKFSQFIIEAKQTRASEQAKQLGLVGDGHGDWYNAQGEFVAKTIDGRLKFFNKGQRLGKRDIPPKPGGRQKSQVGGQPQGQQQSPQQISPQPVPVGPEEQLPSEDEFLTVIFAKFNPPTKEHKKLFTTAKRVSLGGEIRIYPSRTQDSKKNPLKPNRKISHLKKMFPEIKDDVVNNPEMRTIFDVLMSANEDGYVNVNIVVGSDRQAEVQNLANKYNGKFYEFAEIKVIPTGNFDSEKDSSGISSGMLRKSAAENNFRDFRRGVPTKTFDDNEARKLFDELRKAMGFETSVKEDYNLWEIAPELDYKNLRENYINNKIFKIGDIVENMNTGLVGEVIRKGTNYLICVTEDDVMFKSWIYDVMEVTQHNIRLSHKKFEIEVPSKNLKKLSNQAIKRIDDNIDGFVDKDDLKTGPYGAFLPQSKNVPKNFKMKEWTEVSGVPSDQRLIGTDAFREYTMKMSNTKKISNFINKYKAKKASTY